MNPKTDLPCDCGMTAYMMIEPDSPVSMSNGLFLINEAWVIYFCPFCGGKLPDSSKPIFAPYLTLEERARLEALTEGIHSPQEAIARLGPPDYDEPMQTYYKAGEEMPIMGSGIEGLSDNWVLDESITPIRNMEFYNLSQTGQIEFYFEKGQPARHVITPKCLPPRHLEVRESA